MKPYIKVIGLLLLLTAAFYAGTRVGWNPGDHQTSAAGRKVLYWHDPMHPAYKSDRPGIAPDCGMQLEPVYEESVSSGPVGEAALPPGTIQISADKQQLIGIRVERIVKTEGLRNLRILGRVVPDETRIYRITTAINGWIVDALPNTVGSLVRQNETLASFYSPEFLGSQKALIYALNSMDRFKASENEPQQQIQLTEANIQQYKDTLRGQGMSDLQIEGIALSRRNTQKIHIVAPAAGFVQARNVSAGMRFDRGTELYRIADLSRVWILADLFEREGEFVRPGLSAQVRSTQNPTRAFQARVSKVLPQFDPATRTLKVRLEAANPAFALRPEMFVDVEFPLSLPSTLTIPSDALIDTGLQKIVFVDRGNGYFQPRRVETGWRFGDRVEVTRGLMEGESIVVSGNFLLDSESRLRLAAERQKAAPTVDPVCGMGIDLSKAAGKSDFQGSTYYFCSSLCKEKFDHEPVRFAHLVAAVGPETADARR